MGTPAITEEQEEAILQNLREKWQEYAENGFSFLIFLKHESKGHYNFVADNTNIKEELQEKYNNLKNESRANVANVCFMRLAKNGRAKIEAGEQPESMEFAAMQELQKRDIHAEKAAIEREKIKAAKELSKEGAEGNAFVFDVREMTKAEYLSIKGG